MLESDFESMDFEGEDSFFEENHGESFLEKRSLCFSDENISFCEFPEEDNSYYKKVKTEKLSSHFQDPQLCSLKLDVYFFGDFENSETEILSSVNGIQNDQKLTLSRDLHQLARENQEKNAELVADDKVYLSTADEDPIIFQKNSLDQMNLDQVEGLKTNPVSLIAGENPVKTGTVDEKTNWKSKPKSNHELQKFQKKEFFTTPNLKKEYLVMNEIHLKYEKELKGGDEKSDDSINKKIISIKKKLKGNTLETSVELNYIFTIYQIQKNKRYINEVATLVSELNFEKLEQLKKDLSLKEETNHNFVKQLVYYFFLGIPRKGGFYDLKHKDEVDNAVVFEKNIPGFVKRKEKGEIKLLRKIISSYK